MELSPCRGRIKILKIWHHVGNMSSVSLCVAILTLWDSDTMAAISQITFANIFLNWIWIDFDWNFTEVYSQRSNNNTVAFVQIMARYRPGDKSLSETMMVSLLTHICVTRPQLVNAWIKHFLLQHNCFYWISDLLKSIFIMAWCLTDITPLSNIKLGQL